MGTSAQTVNTRTALVYCGAAILIVVVGVRTILQTSEEGGFAAIAYITMGALALEFFLLLLYAYTIYSQDVADKPMAGGGIINVDLEPINLKLDSVIKSNNELKTSVKELLGELSENRTAILEHSETVAELGSNLESIVDGEVDRKIQAEIQRILSSMVSAK